MTRDSPRASSPDHAPNPPPHARERARPPSRPPPRPPPRPAPRRPTGRHTDTNAAAATARASERRAASGGRRPAGRPGPTPRHLNGYLGRHHTANPGERRRLVCDSARNKGAETAVFCCFSSESVPSCFPWSIFKRIWCFCVCVFLCRLGSRSCGYFHAKMRGTRRTAKSDHTPASRTLVSP